MRTTRRVHSPSFDEKLTEKVTSVLDQLFTNAMNRTPPELAHSDPGFIELASQVIIASFPSLRMRPAARLSNHDLMMRIMALDLVRSQFLQITIVNVQVSFLPITQRMEMELVKEDMVKTLKFFLAKSIK